MAAEAPSGGRALDGIRVLDLGQMYSGSYCGLLLAHLGADVVKIEPPGGESMRWRSENGLSRPFLMLNSNKDGIVVDLKRGEGRELFLQLVETADVLIENFSLDVMDRLELDYESVRARNERIVYASGKGYSSTGDYRALPAMDLTIQASTGVMAATGFADSPPTKAGVALADFLGGVHLMSGVLAALVQRERTGRGQLVEVAMQDALVPTLTSNFAGLLDGNGAVPERTGNRHNSLAMSPYNAYPTSDGWLTIFCVRDRHWVDLCHAMQRPDLAEDARYADRYGRVSNMDEVDALVAAWTSGRTRAACMTELTSRHIPAAPVRHVAEVAEDVDLHARGILQTVDYPGVGSTLVFGDPLVLSDSPVRPLALAPTLGQHTDDILARLLALGPEQIAGLRGRGVIG